MIIVNIKGGLGNQMFQYAAGKRLALTNQATMKLDISFLTNDQLRKNVTPRKFELSDFNISEDFASPEEINRMKNLKNSLMRKIFPGYSNNPYTVEKQFHVDEKILALKDNVYLEGHWASEKYFSQIEPVIRRTFILKEIPGSVRAFEPIIQNTNAVCVQIRRGDFITNPAAAKVHGVTPLSYFLKAIAYIQQHIENPVFFVFSDDSTWCMKNLKIPTPVYFVEDELKKMDATRSSDYLHLMSLCNHFIISNSTFGWWGAWLGVLKNKIVVAPEKWFEFSDKNTKDICPPSWIRIGRT